MYRGQDLDTHLENGTSLKSQTCRIIRHVCDFKDVPFSWDRTILRDLLNSEHAPWRRSALITSLNQRWEQVVSYCPVDWIVCRAGSRSWPSLYLPIDNQTLWWNPLRALLAHLCGEKKGYSHGCVSHEKFSDRFKIKMLSCKYSQQGRIQHQLKRKPRTPPCIRAWLQITTIKKRRSYDCLILIIEIRIYEKKLFILKRCPVVLRTINIPSAKWHDERGS